ncbi:tetratricopeptide repeat protein [Polyangium sorediatum]|uniref:Tetratricopeptide repeat protein n=1 Tax=Polyangium sorediatum TaxID=889274 RepID=A0ABT6P0J5_9BACT|nr:hypothetical protein [Polyangium sorediatum]MDI1434073.1 hypothetical protein [Polyangium sorediatum]
MAKDKKKRGASLDPEDVIAGRAAPEVQELIALIREVNPTDRGLDRRETARRYALKSRLQSVLVTRFRETIEIRPEPGEPGVVLLHHRPSGLNACHAVIAELDDDARSFVQRVVDTASFPTIPPPEAPRKTTPRPNEAARAGGAVPDLLHAAEEALAAYDYELARTHLEAALAQSGGDTEAATALLSLLVATLGVDDEALALEEKLPAETLADVHVRLLLALAAARLGERARALRLLPVSSSLGAPGRRSAPSAPNPTNAKAPPTRVAEVFVALARGALTTGDLASAADDIARVRALDVAHPDLVGLVDALAKARATTRGPAEAEATRLFAEGDLHGAEEHAREILAHHPESEIARRIVRAVEEQRKRDEARRKLDDACDALDRGEPQQAVALLEAAKGLGLPEHEATSIEQRIAVKLAAARAQEEEAHAAAIARTIGAGAIAEGLAAYAALPAPGRGRVKELAGSKLFAWMDVVAPPGEGAKGKPAVAAIVALHRAAELAERSPEMTIELLDAHGKVLQGFVPAEDVRKRAQAVLVDERRRVAMGRIEAARRMLEEGDVAHANKLLGEVPRKDLPEDEASAFDRFRVEVQRKLERQTLAASLDQLRREGEALRALAVCEELAARVEGEDVARIAALRGEIRAEVRRKFSVQVETFEGDGVAEGPAATFYDARVAPRWRWEMLLARTRGGHEETVLVVPQSRDTWLFVRVLDAETSALRERVLLRTPRPLKLLNAMLRGRRLLLVGRSGGVLEVDTDDWTVVAWIPNILGDDSRSLPTIEDPEVLVDEATLSPDGRHLWLSVHEKRERTSVLVRVVELKELRLAREIREHRAPNVHVQSVHGLSAPRVVVTEADNRKNVGRTVFYTPRGTPSGKPVPKALLPLTILACPDGESLFSIVGDPNGPHEHHSAQWGFVKVDARGMGPFQALDGVTGLLQATAVANTQARMAFVLVDTERDGTSLFGLRLEPEEPVVAYRVRVPRSSLLVTTPDGSRSMLLTVRQGRPKILPLGPEPPEAGESAAAGAFSFPSLPHRSLFAKRFRCHEPAGKHLEDVIAEERALRENFDLPRRLAWAQQKADADELLALEGALYRISEASTARQVKKIARERFPDHPRVRLSHARALAAVERFGDAWDQLAGIDPSFFAQETDVKHFHHMRGITLMMLDEPEAALAALTQSAAYKEGRCEPDELLPLCAPLTDDQRSWTPGQAVTRDYLRIVTAADKALARGDADAARRLLDGPLVWVANEVQSMARLSDAYLRAEEPNAPVDRFRKAFALLSFCEQFDARSTVTRREMPLPRATWDAERLSALAAKARAWVEEALRLPA